MIDYRYDDGGRAKPLATGTGPATASSAPSAICTGEDYRAVYLTMAEHMKSNGYAASGNAYATRERNRKAPRRKGQITARRVQDRVLEVYGFRKVRLPAGARPDVHGGAPAATATSSSARRSTWRPSWTAPSATPSTGRTYEWAKPRTESGWDVFRPAAQAGVETRERKAQSVWVRYQATEE